MSGGTTRSSSLTKHCNACHNFMISAGITPCLISTSFIVIARATSNITMPTSRGAVQLRGGGGGGATPHRHRPESGVSHGQAGLLVCRRNRSAPPVRQAPTIHGVQLVSPSRRSLGDKLLGPPPSEEYWQARRVGV